MSRDANQELPDVVVSKKHRFSIVWLVPLIAAAIAAYLGYDAYTSRGVPIEITFKDGSGLVAGKTQIKFNGLPVGTVQSLEIGPNLDKVIVKAKLDRHASRVAVQGTEFWVVRPEVGLTGIRGLETVVGGPYIALIPGKGAAVRYFEGLEQPPPADADQPGLSVTVRTESAGSLHVGSPVYYRQISIGVVSQMTLTNTSQHVLIDLHIQRTLHAADPGKLRVLERLGSGLQSRRAGDRGAPGLRVTRIVAGRRHRHGHPQRAGRADEARARVRAGKRRKEGVSQVVAADRAARHKEPDGMTIMLIAMEVA